MGNTTRNTSSTCRCSEICYHSILGKLDFADTPIRDENNRKNTCMASTSITEELDEQHNQEAINNHSIFQQFAPFFNADLGPVVLLPDGPELALLLGLLAGPLPLQAALLLLPEQVGISHSRIHHSQPNKRTGE